MVIGLYSAQDVKNQVDVSNYVLLCNRITNIRVLATGLNMLNNNINFTSDCYPLW